MEKIKIGIVIVTVAFMGIVTGWTWSEIQQTCPGDRLCTLERAEPNPAEIAKYCEQFIPEPEIITEYVPRYITIEKDCVEEVGKAWEECIKSYEAFGCVMPEEKCKGLCPVKIWRGSHTT